MARLGSQWLNELRGERENERINVTLLKGNKLAKPYGETSFIEARRKRAFTYHPPRYEKLLAQASELAKIFDENCPESRELDMAMTKLEESIMWANSAIARNEPNIKHPTKSTE